MSKASLGFISTSDFSGGRAVTTIFILGGGLEVTIGRGLTMVEAEEMKN